MVKVQLNNKSSQFYFAYFLYFLSNFFAIELKNHFCDHWTFTNRTSFLICFDFEPFKYSNLWNISHTRLFNIFSFKKNFKKISIILTIRDILSRQMNPSPGKNCPFDCRDGLFVRKPSAPFLLCFVRPDTWIGADPCWQRALPNVKTKAAAAHAGAQVDSARANGSFRHAKTSKIMPIARHRYNATSFKR